jgi:hypothetical protein
VQKQVNRVGSFGITNFMVSHVWWARQIENRECHLEFWYFRQKKLQNDVHAKGRWGQSSTDDNPSYHYFMISNWADFLSLNNRKDKIKYGLGKVGKNRQAERP